MLVGAEAALRRMLRAHMLRPAEVAEGAAEPPRLILVPPDGVWSGATPLPRDTLLLLPDPSPLRALRARLGEHAAAGNGSDGVPPDAEDVAAAVGLADFLAVGRAVLRAADLLKEGLQAFCGDRGRRQRQADDLGE